MSNRTKNSSLDLDPELGDTAKMLDEAVERIKPDPAFQAALEHRLKTSRSQQEVSTMPSLRKFAPVLLWILAAALMVLVLDWAIRSLAPEPVPASQGTPVSTSQVPAPPVDQSTPVPPKESYDWHGVTLSLATTLPDSPSEADVYLAQPIQHATTEEALALAQRFGIQGDAYQMPGELPGTTDFMVTDGKQSLRVRSVSYFSYTADMIKAYNYFEAVTNPDAETIIGTFLESHGFTVLYRMEWSDFRSAYLVEPLASDGSPLRYEYYSPPMLLVTLDENSQVSGLQASLLGVAGDAVGRYGVLTAGEALQRLLDPNTINGMIQSMHAAAAPIQQWNRTYPLNQTVTIYGTTSSMPSVRLDKPPFIQIDGFPVVGQVSRLDKLSQRSYVQAAGRFVTENGVERFNIDSWKLPDVNEDGLIGTLNRENGQVTLTTQDGAHYVLPNVPADIPMPFENAFVIGTRTGDVFQWKLIDNRMAAGGGGGGGGGGGSSFYKLNLNGTPVPLYRPTPRSETGQDALGRQIENERGLLSITIYKEPDGSQRAEYHFFVKSSDDAMPEMLLEGGGLESLLAYQNRPINIWGVIDHIGPIGIPVVRVDRFEVPFPDLKLQVIKGTNTSAAVAGQPAILLKADDGITYVELNTNGEVGMSVSLLGREGDRVQVEALVIPDESLGGYPALRVFSGATCESGACGGGGGSGNLDQPYVMDEPPTVPAENNPVPTATIEKVELVHFLSDPRYAVSVPDAQPHYFQPVWRFYGHYSNGDEFEILIQALRDEYLLPEIDPYLQGG